MYKVYANLPIHLRCSLQVDRQASKQARVRGETPDSQRGFRSSNTKNNRTAHYSTVMHLHYYWDTTGVSTERCITTRVAFFYLFTCTFLYFSGCKQRVHAGRIHDTRHSWAGKRTGEATRADWRAFVAAPPPPSGISPELWGLHARGDTVLRSLFYLFFSKFLLTLMFGLVVDDR